MRIFSFSFVNLFENIALVPFLHIPHSEVNLITLSAKGIKSKIKPIFSFL